jgi:hypothetical protein
MERGDETGKWQFNLCGLENKCCMSIIAKSVVLLIATSFLMSQPLKL